MLLLINRDPIVIDRLTGGSDRKSGIDFSADVFQTQHPIIFTIDPDAAAIAGDCFRGYRSAFAPPEGLVRKLFLYFVLINDRSTLVQSIGVDHSELGAGFGLEEVAQRRHVFAGRGRAS